MDSRLHDAIARSCGNTLLAKEIGRLTILFRAFRDVAWECEAARCDYRRLAAEAHEHLAIVEALMAGDRRAASRAMARHIHSGMKYWCRALPEPPVAGTPVQTRSALALVKRGSPDESDRNAAPPGHDVAATTLVGLVALRRDGPARGADAARSPRSSTTATSGRSWPRTASPATGPTAPRARPTSGSTAARRPSRPEAIVPGDPEASELIARIDCDDPDEA